MWVDVIFLCRALNQQNPCVPVPRGSQARQPPISHAPHLLWGTVCGKSSLIYASWITLSKLSITHCLRIHSGLNKKIQKRQVLLFMLPLIHTKSSFWEHSLKSIWYLTNPISGFWRRSLPWQLHQSTDGLIFLSQSAVNDGSFLWEKAHILPVVWQGWVHFPEGSTHTHQ